MNDLFSAPPPQTLLLIDGSSYLYRAFHAMPDLRNNAGAPTGALYGMINMMRRMTADYPKATHHVCVFDAKGKTFRDDLYPAYKATRSPMPDDMRLQIEPIHAVVAALGWHVLTVPGVEADDVIGTLAVQAAAQNCQTIISTGDKDMAQLVNAQVLLVNTMTNERMGRAGVEDKFGVPPDRIVDYLALIGDTVDNVPGVMKCGPKTAVKWLLEYGTLDNIIANADKIGGVVGENLRKALPDFPLTRELLKIKCDVDLSEHTKGLDFLRTPPQNLDVQKQIFDTYGFRTWYRELTGDAAASPAGDSRVKAAVPASDNTPPPPPVVAANYETIYSEAALNAWLTKIQAAPLVALDTETNALGAWQARLVGISLCVAAGEACYIPTGHTYGGAPEQLPLDLVLATLKPWLESAAPNAQKVLQHAKFDMHVFANHGIALRGVAHDTLLAAYTLESHKKNNLGALAERWLGRKGVAYEDLCGKGASAITMDQVDVERAAHYAAEDADFTFQIHALQQVVIQADAGLKRIYELEIASQPALFDIERTGVLVDAAKLNAQSAELGATLMKLEQSAYEIAGQPFNLNSPKQLGEIMYGTLGYPAKNKTATGAPSTDEDTLQELAADYPLPKVLLEYRGLAKLKSTYTDKLPTSIEPRTGRVHTHYAQAAVVTGRLSSSEPNLQNIPVKTQEGRRIRQAFVAPAGSVIVSADYSQIELRIMAHVSQDPALIKAFLDGEDVHRATAAEVFGVPVGEVNSEQRRYAKVINFGLIYGMSAFGLASNLGIGNSEAKNYIDRYFARYIGVKQYMDRTKLEAKSQGYVSTVFGRRLWLPDINASGPRRGGAERAAINAPMQGTAADLIKMAMVNINDWLKADGLTSRIVMQVHDELVLEVPASELELMKAQVPLRMAAVAKLAVPLLAEVGVGTDWDGAH
jgi:DNA polymerase-1